MPLREQAPSKGLVVTDHKLASLAGAKILKQGGNAVDAAVATATALSVIDPFMSGLTGFGYLLFYNANDDQVYALDFIGTAPAAASIDLYNKEKPWEDYKPTAEGILAALVPGSVAGWSAITEKFGRMRWKELLAPAIELAGGFTVSTEIHRHYEFLKPRAMMNPITARTFYKDGSFPEPGELFSQKDLARTLEMLAERGAEDFYRGEIAKKMVAYIQEAGGIITEEDLASYKVEWTRPVVGTYSDHRLFSHAPGSSGITVLQWLNILEGSNFEGIGWDTDSFIHTFLEAGKLTLRDDDMYNTGKDYVKVPVELLTSKKYAAKQRSQINPEQAKFYPLVSASRPFPQGTTTFCTCDAEGNMVSMTLTQMYGFDRVGLIGNLGFNLNGGICYFSLDPNHIERLEPRQRPRYVMSPTIAFKDDMTIAIGAAGGWTIPQTITQTLMKILEFDMEAQEAVSSPRFVMRYRYNSIPYPPGTTVELEDGIPDLTRKSLDRRGHRIFKPPLNFPSRYRHGLVNALTYENGTMQGGAEIRRDGYAAVC